MMSDEFKRRLKLSYSLKKLIKIFFEFFYKIKFFEIKSSMKNPA